MTGSIFPVCSLDRERSRWEEHLYHPTPVEERDGILYKREDYFAPLGYGGINGMKLRQLVWLVHDYADSIAVDPYQPKLGRRDAEHGIVTGASVLSPQISMAALVGAHYQLPVTVVVGATTETSAPKHENVAIAQEVGAEFRHIGVAYNPALQRAVADLHAERPGWYRLHYGISPVDDADAVAIEAFHAVGSMQTGNIPEGVRTLVMTAGSCMSCVSVLYGLARARPKSLDRVVLVGVGPTRLRFIQERLETLGEVCGWDIAAVYRRRYHHTPFLEPEHQNDGPVLLEHFDLHATKYATYQDRMPWAQDGIEFHPTYEGKALRYLNERGLLPRHEGVLFWIVGSAPSRAAMQDTLLLEWPTLAGLA